MSLSFIEKKINPFPLFTDQSCGFFSSIVFAAKGELEFVSKHLIPHLIEHEHSV